jgi:ABC-type transporter Mla MlaB component
MATRCPEPCTIDCDVSALAPDAAAVDVLARLQLAGRRLGLHIRLRNASAELQELVAFFGLRDALRVEVERQAEQREQRLGVEEERELDDPAG